MSHAGEALPGIWHGVEIDFTPADAPDRVRLGAGHGSPWARQIAEAGAPRVPTEAKRKSRLFMNASSFNH